MLSLVEVAARQAYERARILPDAEMQRGRKTIAVLGTKLTAAIQSHAKWIVEQHCQSLRAAIGHRLPLVPFRFGQEDIVHVGRLCWEDRSHGFETQAVSQRLMLQSLQFDTSTLLWLFARQLQWIALLSVGRRKGAKKASSQRAEKLHGQERSD